MNDELCKLSSAIAFTYYILDHTYDTSIFTHKQLSTLLWRGFSDLKHRSPNARK